jgi:recombination protein RecA
MVPRAELEGDMGDSHIGLQARLMSQALRKLTAAISKSNTSVVFINQVREKVGVFWGSPEVTPGGRALKFYSSVRIDLRKIESLKQGTEIIGNRVRARVVKNKLAAPFKTAEFDIMFNEGISQTGDLLDLAVEHSIVKKNGAFYSFGEIQIGRGREKSKLYLKENPVLVDEISELVKQALNPEPLNDVIVPVTEPMTNNVDE